uniref:Uncharacterized protein n=1 Tax=Haptolina ericina TaxID=156174 RepID=A0A7S3B5U6_9EUKA
MTHVLAPAAVEDAFNAVDPNGKDPVADAAAATRSAAAAAAVDNPALSNALQLSAAAHSLSEERLLDEMLWSAGMRPVRGEHNSTGELIFDLGQAYGSKTWKTGLMQVLPELLRIKEEGDRLNDKESKTILKRAKRCFDEAAVPSVNRGRVVLSPSIFRSVVCVKPDNCCTRLVDLCRECGRDEAHLGVPRYGAYA